MFVRLADAGIPTTLLRTQYRMHPKLATFPNSLFYQDKLLDGVSAEDRFPLLVPHPGKSGFAAQPLPPFRFINVADGLEQSESGGSSYGGSLVNVGEVEAVRELVRVLLVLGIEPHQIGVIVPYRQQAARIQAAVQAIQVDPNVRQPKRAIILPQRAKRGGGTPRKGKSDASAASPLSAKQQFAAQMRNQSSNSSESTTKPSAETPVLGAGVQISTVDAFQGQ